MTFPPYHDLFAAAIPPGCGRTRALRAFLAEMPVAAREAILDEGLPTAKRENARPGRIPRPPDGLRTEAEAAAKLGISIRTLREHVAAGALPYVNVGRGKQRARRRFADCDLDAFIASQTRKDSLCPSDATRARRSGNTTSRLEIIAFSDLQKRRRNAKLKR